jgi:hypothetical protein
MAGTGDEDAEGGNVDPRFGDDGVVGGGDAPLDWPGESPNSRRGTFERRRPAVLFFMAKIWRVEVADRPWLHGKLNRRS